MFLPADQGLASLGRIGGIPIRLNASFLLVPLLMLKGLPTKDPWLAAGLLAFGTGAIFLSVLLHELGHALAARHHGVATREIGIGGFYGYAELTRLAPTRGAGVQILLAGPLANLLIFLWVWAIVGFPEISSHLELGRAQTETMIQGYPWLTRMARWVAMINLSMALFNMLPAFPLDGGRIYRNLLVPRVGATRAVKIIAACGMIVGLWCILGIARYGVVLTVIGLQLLVTNLLISGEPRRGEAD